MCYAEYIRCWGNLAMAIAKLDPRRGSDLMDQNLSAPLGYNELLQELKTHIREAQVRAAMAVSRELVLLYWTIGREISRRFDQQGWGTKIVDRLARDLQTEFPGVEGFSPRNLRYMRSLAEAWPEPEILQQLIARLPWGHNIRVLDKVKDRTQREWYLRAALEYGWSQNVLSLQIDTGLHEREGKALTNFQRTLPPPGSDLAQQVLKDPYNFDFLTLAKDAEEREIERGLLLHLRDLLLELGRGFAFVGSQLPLTIAGDTFYLDLLFYHLRLHCYFVIELKTGKFKPEWAGKLGFYLSAVDDLFRTEPDAPTIGLLLCETHNSAVVEYALRDVAKPIGVSTFRVTRELPAPVRSELPTVEALQGVIAKLKGELDRRRTERGDDE